MSPASGRGIMVRGVRQLSAKTVGRLDPFAGIGTGAEMTRGTMMYLVLALSVATTCIAAEIPIELHQTIQARDEAVAKKDAATWDRLTMPNFIAIRPEGMLMNKAERLAQLKAAKPEARPKPKQEQFIRHGDTVLRQLQEANGTLWIDVWVKDGQTWRVASSQGTPPKK